MENSKNIRIKKITDAIFKNWLAKAVSIVLAIILTLFYKNSLLGERYMSLPLICENTGDLVPARIIPRMIKISVSGESSAISSIREDDITAYIDVSNFPNEGEYRVPIQFKLKGTALDIEPLELKPEPTELKVKLERSFLKSVDIKLAIKGSPAEDYEIYETSIDPANISVRGPYSAVEKLEDLITESIQVYDRKKDLSGTASVINTNSLISTIGSGKIQYTVKIREVLKTKDYNGISLYFEELDENLEITSELPPANLTVRGSKSAAESWKPPQNVLRVNCKSIKKEGKYTLPVQAVVPGKLELINAEPKNIQIEVKRKK